jgi:PAS domain S-box-containing protein
MTHKEESERQSESEPPVREALAGGGEVGALMRAYDWSSSLLGPVEQWPEGLKTAVRIMLTSRYAMWLGWGESLVFLYNDSYARMTLGKKHPWALGQRAQDVWAEIWADIGPRIEHVIQSGEATWDEALLLFLERSGFPEETYHTFSYSPLSDDTGKIAGMFCVVTEETERVIGERRLRVLREAGTALAAARTQEEVFTAIARSLEGQSQDLPFTLAYLFDVDGQTARLVATTGVPSEHPMAIPEFARADTTAPWPLEMMWKQAAPVLVEDLASRFPTLPTGCWDKPPTQAILVPLASQGSDRSVGFIIAGLNPYRSFDEEYGGFIRLLADQIAASLASAQAYEQERQRAAALAELDRAKTAFFSNISHEFRTPLTLMLGPIEDALADPNSPLPPQQRERLEIAYRNTVRLLRLANNLLDFTRLEAGRMQASFQPTDLATVTADLASSFRSALERAGLDYQVDCSPLPEPVYVDQDMWEKIVLNLLSNAFKYTLRGGVYVSLAAVGDQVAFSVRDTGVGIPEKDLHRVFERFHRVEDARGRTHEGTGIGLSLVQELVKLHGGEVRVESVVGEGTTFTVLLPLGSAHLPAERLGGQSAQVSTALSADTYAQEALRLLPTQDTVTDETVPPSEAAPPVSSEAVLSRIIVADDNADMRDYIARLLGERYAVETVTNGREALEAIRRKRPDLVISDIMMPEMDGFALLAALRAEETTNTLPIILLSARAGEDARVEGIHAGADDYLVKPFSRRELQARVSSLLQLVRLRRQATEAAERFRAAFEDAAVGLLITDADGQFLEANPAFCQTVGYSEQELAALDSGTLTYPDDREENRRLLEQLREGHIPSYLIEQRYIRKDGAIVWVQNSVSVIREEPGRPNRIIALSENITERVLAREERERQFQETQRRAEREALLNHIRTTIAPLTEPEEIQAATVQILGEAMQVDRCYFAEYDVPRNWARVGKDWYRPGLNSLAGSYHLSGLAIDARQMFHRPDGLLLVEDVNAAEPTFSPDAAAHLMTLGLHSLLGVAVLENGLPVAALMVAMAESPRVWTDDEIELVRAVSALVHFAVEDARLRLREHNIAEHLQAALQPALPSGVPGLDLNAFYRPALAEANIGGDFYDVFPLEPGCLALVVADLSGKGLAAAAQVATVRHMLRALLYRQDTTVAETMTQLNAMLVGHGLLEGFATLFVGVYDVNQHTLRYVNAGQEPGLVVRKNVRAGGRVQELRPTGTVLGGFEGATFEEFTLSLSQGDVLALFTDGLTEAGRSRKDLLGVPGIISIFEESVEDATTAADIVGRMIAGVEARVTPAGIRDDACLLIGCVE